MAGFYWRLGRGDVTTVKEKVVVFLLGNGFVVVLTSRGIERERESERLEFGWVCMRGSVLMTKWRCVLNALAFRGSAR